VSIIHPRENIPARLMSAGPRLYWLLLLSMVGPGCDLPGKPKPAARPSSADQIVDFDRLYQQNCAGCHGADGQLGPAPPLNDKVFLAIVPDSVLVRVISEGRPGTPMPAFAGIKGGPLTDTQVKALAAGIKPRWKPTQTLQGSPPDYAIAISGETGDTSRGTKVFARACAPCHGSVGEGKENGDGGAGAINDAAFLALISDQALRRYAITGRPDLGMPNYADKSGRPDNYTPLTGAEIVDLVALLSSWRQTDRLTSSTGP
jgi:cytochrome c oxidase cbb3-type subunit III